MFNKIFIAGNIFLLLTASIVNDSKGAKYYSFADSLDVTKAVSPLEPLNMERVKQIATILPETPKGFGENYHNRAVWDNLYNDPQYFRVIKTAEGLLNKPFPAWSDEQYLIYFRKGTRPEGEKMLRDRFGWLAPLVWAECLENKGRFTPAIEMVLTQLIHQKAWTLPAHDKDKQNLEGKRYSVDLNAAGMGHGIAQAIYLLDDKLSPAVRTDVLAQLYVRMFGPVLKTIETKDNNHFWLTVTSNWNSVCLSGVTGAALAAIPDRTERAKFVAISERYSKNSVAGFTDEGYCTEGLGYYGYGFSHYILQREAILQATKQKIDLFADPKIKKIAAYAPNLEIINNVYPNIADCRVDVKAPPDVLWYCSRVLGLGLKKYDDLQLAKPGDLIEDVMHTFPNSASQKAPVTAVTRLAPGIRSYFKEAGVLIVRPGENSKSIIAAAVKGGNNNEIHNHNDVGSYTIAVGDELMMGDPGGPFAYHSNTFGPERYTYKALASYGHPVPLMGGKQQRPGLQAQAKILETSFSADQDKFSMDISSAYDLPGLMLKRTFTYNRKDKGQLKVEDIFSCKAPSVIETALITRVQCKQISPTQLEFKGKHDTMLATITAPSDFAVSYETIHEDEPDFTRVSIRLKNPVQAGTITIVFTPVNN